MATNMSAVMTWKDQDLRAERIEAAIRTAIARDTDLQSVEEVAALRLTMAHHQIEQ